MTSEVSEIRGAFPQRGPVTFGHMDYKELQRQGIVRPEFARSALSFAFVRNPFDRFVSLYYYLTRLQRFHGSFLEFVDAMERGVEPIGLFNVRGLSQCNPQADWIFDDAGYSVVDHVFRMEQFADEIEVLAGMLGISPLVLHENKSPRSAGTLELFADNGLRERVSHLYRRDFDLLGYDPDSLPH